MTDCKILGRRGEAAAQKYLSARGYKIIAANVRLGRKEIDLIARQGRQTVFVEVKTRRFNPTDGDNRPLAAKQSRNLGQAIATYAQKNRLALETVRLDLIIIVVTGPNRAKLKHYRDIFNY
jgi:putative endonuclease